MKDISYIKGIIATAKTHYVSVVFEKKDGSEREIVFNPKVKKAVLGENATERGKKAVATRKQNNPNLLPVFDSQLASKGTPADKCWRSVNLNTVKRIKVGGQEYKF